MSGQTVTGERIWAAMMADPAFLNEMPAEAQREACKPFFLAAPEVLASLLDKPVTLATLTQAKLDFLRYAAENGFIRAAVTGTPMEGFADTFKEVVDGLIQMLADIAQNVPAFLEENGLTEEEVILGPAVGLNPENTGLYRAGTLTIGQVLLTQPSIIFKNN